MAEDHSSNDGVLTDTFRSVLKKFGTSPPQITVIIGIIIGSFGYTDSFNPGIWTIVSLICFGIIYVLWPYISSNTMWVSAYSATFVIVFVVAALLIRWQMADLWSEFTSTKALFTTFWSVTLTIPAAWIIASHSKAKHEEKRSEEFWQTGKLDGSQVPEPIFAQVKREIASRRLFKKDIAYHIEARRDGDKIAFQTEMSYTVTNNGPIPEDWYAEYLFGAAEAMIKAVTISRKPIDIGRKGYCNDRGVTVPKTIAAGESIEVAIQVLEIFNARGSELYTSYTPGTNFLFYVRHDPSIEFWYDKLFASDRAIEKKEDEFMECRISGGMLPYQGIRLWWAPKQH